MSIKSLGNWLIISLILIANTIPLASADTFTDLDVGDRYFVAINSMKEMGIINGYEDGSFKSWQKINRAEALKMIIGSQEKLKPSTYKIPETSDIAEKPFQDTPQNEWYTPYLHVAKEQGLISGYPDNTFKPEQTINLVEALKIILESYGGLKFPDPKEFTFADVEDGAWFEKYTAYAKQWGLIEISNENTINPNLEMTRGHLTELIYRKIMSEKGYVFGKSTYYGAAVHGNSTASGEQFDMYEMTAAHKTLPFGTIVEVTNLANGKSVQVKITDRGPYGPGRVIDLTSSAFKEISTLSMGVAQIQYQIISLPES